MRASLTALAVALLLVAVTAATGCGLKGDLYLPESEAPDTAPEPSGETEETRQADAAEG